MRFDMGRCGSMIWMDAVYCVRMNECGLIRANSVLIEWMRLGLEKCYLKLANADGILLLSLYLQKCGLTKANVVSFEPMR